MADDAGAAPLWTGHAIAQAVGGILAEEDFDATGVAIDSREVAPGDLFVALSATRDGHMFVPAAQAAGAAGALVSRRVEGPHVRVEGDVLLALQALAVAARDRAGKARRGVVTGSVGKTSVTQAVLSGLRLAGGGHGPERSFNNHIGVPLTLARMPGSTRRAVFELGMNHAGEIAPLSRLVQPHAALITTVEAVHIEAFADGEAGVARAKAEIFAGLRPGGVAILNADNRWFPFLQAEAEAVGAEIRAFGQADGIAGGAVGDLGARLIGFTPQAESAFVEAEIEGHRRRYPLRQTAPHWGPMSLAALLMLRALEVDLEIALAALSAIAPLDGRGAETEVHLKDGSFTLIDDSYNASPVSVAAALRALGQRAPGARRIAVLTDMLELGPDGADRHADLAAVAAEAGVDLVFTAGPLMRRLDQALEASRRGAWTAEAKDMTPILAEVLQPGDVVLVKGSKASHASDIAMALKAGRAGVEGGGGG